MNRLSSSSLAIVIKNTQIALIKIFHNIKDVKLNPNTNHMLKKLINQIISVKTEI